MSDDQIRAAQAIADEICQRPPLEYIKEQEALLELSEPGSTIKRVDKNGNVVTRTVSYSGIACDSFRIPHTLVTHIFGYKGETLRNAEQACRVRIQIDREGSAIERLVVITGRPKDVDKAKEMVDNVLLKGVQQSHMPQDATNSLRIPAGKLGLIIGKQGSMLKELQSKSQARIIIPRDQDGPERTLIFEGDQQNVQRARRMITDLISVQLDWVNSVGQSSIVMSIPVTKIGLVIGRGGEQIKQLNQITGTIIKIDSNANTINRNITIAGEPDACQEAKRRIEELINTRQVY